MRKRAVIVSAWLTGLVLAFEVGRGFPATKPEEASPSAAKSFREPGGPRSQSLGLQPARAFAESLQGLRESGDFQALFGALQPSFETPETHDSLLLLADAWAASFPKEASQWLHQQSFGDTRNPFLFAAFSQWAATDDEGAMRWLNSSYPEKDSTRDYLLASLIRGVARSDPDRAWEFVNSLSAGPEQSGSIDFVVKGWFDQGLPTALAKVEELVNLDDPLQAQVVKRLLANLPLSDLPAAREWAAALSDNEQKASAQIAIAANWAQRDREGALEWVNGLSDAVRRNALGEVATRWARDKPYEAAAWIAEAGPLRERDLANRAISWSLVGIDPEAAFSQIATITNPLLREETFEQVGRLWLSSDPQQAYAYLQKESPLPPDIRATLLQSFQ